jgi:hypothetical protein
MQSHDLIVMHTMAGYLTGTDAMFKRNGWSGTESHFGVGGAWGGDRTAGLDGVVYQWQDTEFRADANLDANRWAISIETADNAPLRARDIEAWTPKQLDAIVKLVAWCCRTYGIPPILVPDSKPGRRGIAYHRQGISPWKVAGGDTWSTSPGKECPGDRRINQIRNVVIPRVQGLLNPKPPVVEDIVATKAELRTLLVDLIKTEKIVPNKVLDAGTVQGADWTLAGVLAASDQKSDLIRREQTEQAKTQQSQSEALTALAVALKASAADVKRLEGKVDTLIALLTPKPPAT